MPTRKATFARYRHGRVKTIKNPHDGRIHEYRVGPVPPANGISGYRKSGQPIYVKLDGKGALEQADYRDILNALARVKTQFVYPVVYLVKTSGDRKKPNFHWWQLNMTMTKDLRNDVAYAGMQGWSIEEFAQRKFSFGWQLPPNSVLAWNFIEVY